MNGLKRKNSQGWDPEPKKEKSKAKCRQTGNNHQSYQDSPDTEHPTRWWTAHRRRRTIQCLNPGSAAVEVHRRGHRDPCLDAEAAWIQKIVEIPQLQHTEEKVDITAESSEVSVDAAGSAQREAG